MVFHTGGCAADWFKTNQFSAGAAVAGGGPARFAVRLSIMSGGLCAFAFRLYWRRVRAAGLVQFQCTPDIGWAILRILLAAFENCSRRLPFWCFIANLFCLPVQNLHPPYFPCGPVG